MIYKILIALTLLLPQSEDVESQFLVKLESGKKVIGTCEQEIRLETSFGYSVFRADQIRGIDRKDDEFTIRSAAGDSIKGTIEGATLTLINDGEEKKVKFIDDSVVDATTQR